MMVHVHVARQAYRGQEISNIGFVKSSATIADGLKRGKMQNNPLSLLQNGFDDIDYEQSILQ